MKRKLTNLILTLALVLSGCIFFASNVKAQECSWTLYVNGEKYSTSASYYTSGALKLSGSTLTLNNFTGDTIQAIPGGAYGDDDAPSLTINVKGECTLTGGKLDDGSYGMIYVEPRSGGSGADSTLRIQSDGTLNLTYSTASTATAKSADYNLIRADQVLLSGSVVYNITAKLYGFTGDYTLYGVNANTTYFTFSSRVNMQLTTGTARVTVNKLVKRIGSSGSVIGVKGKLIHNSTDYANIDTNVSANSSTDIRCADTVYANGMGLYLENIPGVQPYTSSSTASSTEYIASDENMYYCAFVSKNKSSNLKQISVTDIVSEAKTKFDQNGYDMISDQNFTEREEQGYYAKTTMKRVDLPSGQVWADDSMFHAETSLEYAYMADIKAVPMPGYQVVADDMGYTPLEAAATSVLGYAPEDLYYNSAYGDTYLYYSYVLPTITKQPATAYDLGNLSDVSVAAETPREKCQYDKENFYWQAQMHYEWYLRVYYNASTYADFEMSTIGGEMDGFEHLDTANPDLGFDETYKNFKVEVNGKTVKLGNAYKLEMYCKVSTIADYVKSDMAELLLDHTEVVLPATDATCTESGRTEGKKCSVCGQVLTKQMIIPALGHNIVAGTDKAATCTEPGQTGGKVCSRCNAVMEAPTTIPALGHHEVAKPDTPATLEANGTLGGTYCDVCKADIKIGEVIYYPASIELSAYKYTYNGSTKNPGVLVENANGEVIDASNYTVKYESGRKNVGIYTATITFKGNYSGETDLSFEIVPKSTSISKISALTKGFKVTWKKQTSQTKGYLIRYSTSSKMTNAKTVTVSSNKTTSKSITKLSKKKKYYVQVCTYKTVLGQKLCSAWSAKKKVTTK